jgi:hypothetical protein
VRKNELFLFFSKKHAFIIPKSANYHQKHLKIPQKHLKNTSKTPKNAEKRPKNTKKPLFYLFSAPESAAAPESNSDGGITTEFDEKCAGFDEKTAGFDEKWTF